MVVLKVGAGGWAYFRVPGENSLKSYSSAFDFVEVNSTYYEHPRLRSVSLWRRAVPESFEFSVRVHRGIVDAFNSEGSKGIADVVERTEPVCRILKANILTLLLPTDRLKPDRQLKGLKEFLSTFETNGTRVAVEFRGRPPDARVCKTMEDNNAIHCVDLSREKPAYESDVLYTRLFGKGQDNIYQFDDDELQNIAKMSSAPRFEKSMLAFHGVRMYGDAARLKMFLKTGDFPMVTGQLGLDSLRTVLEEDVKFPASKAELVKIQGWKLFDESRKKRARAESILRKLPEGNYQSLDSVISTLKAKSTREGRPTEIGSWKKPTNS